jgi:hypothetical protein
VWYLGRIIHTNLEQERGGVQWDWWPSPNVGKDLEHGHFSPNAYRTEAGAI